MKLPISNLSLKLFLCLFLIVSIPLITTSVFSIIIFKDIPGKPTILLEETIIIALNLGLMLALTILIFQMLIGPIKKIFEGSNYFIKGYYKYRIPKQTDDELGKITENFNTLAALVEDAALKAEHNKNTIIFERNRLSLTLSSVKDAIITLDPNFYIILWNQSASDLTGYSEQNALGKKFDQLVKFYSDQGEIPINIYCPPSSSYEDIFESKDVKLVGVNQKQPKVNMLTKRVNNQTGQVISYVISLHDMTKESELESMKLDFVSMAAHELRTPLTSIKGYLQVYMDENAKSLNVEQKMFLDRIGIATQQLSALVENILSVSKIERGTFSITTSPVDWAEFVKQLVNDSIIRASSKKIGLFYIEPTQQIPKLNVDKIRITEVLNNMISNAINYTEVGGEIKVWLEIQDQNVVTHIQDNGVGLSPESINNLFTKFFRVQGKLEGTMKGNGLGLYISKSIIELHRGKIWAQSEGLGKGTTFSFSLPISKDKEFNLK